MPTFGSYEARREVAGAGFCARWEASLSAQSSAPGAKPFGDRFLATAVGPSVVVPWLPRAGLDEEARRLVGAARDQAQLVGAGAKRWSIIADFGLMDDGRGAFVVRPSLSWTVERLVLAQYVFTSVELRGIILGVVEGLIELDRNAARPWGNLNSSTVMLSVGPGDAKLGDGTGVVLTELESRERLSTDAHIADLRALGRLIYEMVLHKRPPLKAANGWSATWSDGWEVVGDGRWWFDLANRLMAAGTALGEAGNPPTLAQVKQAILEHRAHKPLPKRQLYLAGGIAAFVVLAGGAYLALRTPAREAVVLTADQLDEKARLSRWQGLIERWRLWFGDLYAAREQVAQLAATQPAGSTIRAISETLHDPALQDPRVISGVGTGASLLDLYDRPGDAIQGDKIVAAAASLEKIEEVRRLLSEWPELLRLRDVADQWDKRGWTAASLPLRSAVEAVPEAIPAVIAREGASEASPTTRSGAIVPAVVGAQEAIASASSVESAWDSIAKGAELPQSAKDPVMKRLGSIASAEADRAVKSAEAGKPALAALRQTLESLAAIVAEDLGYLQGRVEGWDLKGFASSDALKSIASGPDNQELLTRWKQIAAMPEFARVDAADPREPALAKFKSAQEQLRSEGERLADMAKGGRELTMQPAEFDSRLKEVQASADELADTAWSNRNRAAVETRSAQLIQSVDALQRDLKDALTTGMLPLSEALATQDRGLFSSTVLKSKWTAALDAASVSSSKRDAFASIRRERDQLLALDRAIPESPAAPSVESERLNVEAWRRAAGAARERILAETLRSNPPDAKLAASKFGAWMTGAAEYLRLAGEASTLLAQGDELNGPRASSALNGVVDKMNALPDASEFAPVIPSVSGSIAEMRRFAGSNDAGTMAEAIRTASSADAPVALAAWARLAEIEWPTNAAQFAQAREFASRVLPELIEKGITQGARERVRDGVAERARSIWSAFMNGRAASDRAGIDLAMANAGLFGVTPTEERLLSRGARYNAMLWELSRDAGEYAAAQAKAGVGPGAPAAELAAQTRVAADLLLKFQQQSGAIGVESSGAVAGVARQLGEIAKREARPAFDPLKSGPAALRNAAGQPLWSAEKHGEGVVYTLNLPPGRLAPGQGTVRVEFQPVKIDGPGGPIATYVSTHEVSVSTFVGAFESRRGNESWEQLQKTLRYWDHGKDDPRPGPATWSWDLRRAKVTLSDRSKESVAWKDQSGWLRGHPTMEGKPYYAPEIGEVAPPSYDSPMDWVSPDAALLAARQMGVRLPTMREWLAAVDSAGGAEKAANGQNRRDKTWTLQFKYIEKLDVIGKEWPHAGIFWPKNLKPTWQQADGKSLYVNASDDSALTFNDGYLWFAPVSRDSEGWSYLIGNVSEIVLEGAGDEMATVDTSADAVRPFVEKAAEKWRIVGASALSAITLREGKAYDALEGYQYPSLREARMGYSDVGFRLAFSEGGTGRPRETPAELLAKVLSAAPYLDGK
ncbi:MAG: hypothetical protein JSS51_05585 [Planctomycetes bacterium]|nr:hypothetical protein [Planctomycetota bacterium]